MFACLCSDFLFISTHCVLGKGKIETKRVANFPVCITAMASSVAVSREIEHILKVVAMRWNSVQFHYAN